MSLASDRGREKGRPFGSMEGRRNETTWQGIRTFGKPQAKGLVGISGERNRNGNLVQSKGFLLIVAPTQRRVDRHQNRKLLASGTPSTRLILRVQSVKHKYIYRIF